MTRSIRSPFLSLVIAALALSCGDSNSNKSDLTGEISGQALRIPNGLGQGFESDTQTLKANCISGDTVYVGGSEADVSYSQDVTFDQVIDSISGGANIGAKINIFDVKGAAEFASKQASDDFSSTITLISTASVKKAVMTNLKLTKIGQFLSKGGVVADTVRKNCGDEYVSQINYSAKLFVNAKFRFASPQDKLEFKGSANVSLLGIGELGGQISSLNEKIKSSSTVTITAHQIGGNPEELGKVLDDSIVSCTLAQFETKCLPMLQAVVRYAREDFPRSLANDPIPTSARGWAEVLYMTDKYSDTPLIDGDNLIVLSNEKEKSIIDQEMDAARSETNAEYQRQLVDYQRSVDLLRDFTLDSAQRANITNVQTSTLANRNLLSKVGETCLKTPLKCVSALQDYKKAAKLYDSRALSTAYCMIAEDVMGSSWSFGAKNGGFYGDMRFAADGTILNYRNDSEYTWAVKGCILRLYNSAGFPSTVFDTIHSKNLLEGNFVQLSGQKHVLKRLD
ncbi:MAG: hypothetical protein EOP10_10645 [Proteobacteria bacterium]|nr:MAG: hypothetical protein EOP10_10645 [Pseudomonadota bacterium]